MHVDPPVAEGASAKLRLVQHNGRAPAPGRVLFRDRFEGSVDA